MMISHEVNLLGPWPLLHTWPLPDFLESVGEAEDRAGGPAKGVSPCAPTHAEQVRGLVQLGAWECDLQDDSLR